MELNRAFYAFETNASFKGPEGRAVDQWFMMSSIWPAVILTSAYLYFVFLAGPKFMKNRKPYSLKPVLLAYNLFQVIFSSWLFIKGIKETYGVFFKGACTPSILSYKTSYEVDSLVWYYLMSKYFEFLDTIFFVLRGKTRQVTFLHVYHHTNMAIFTWIYCKYINGSQTLMIGLCNSFVHAAMYGYYLLAAFGPNMSKFLWWKRYITKLQIMAVTSGLFGLGLFLLVDKQVETVCCGLFLNLQFLLVIGYMLYLHFQGCSTPNGFILFSICNTASFLVLFLLFYATAYTHKRKLQ